jgi:1-acyl-sn-glycerol-3-phosphate acyltransferase
LATGLSFALFCVGGIALALFGLCMLTVQRDRSQRCRRMRAWLSRTFRIYLRLLRALGLITYEIQGRERLLPRGQLIIANHPSLLDVCFIIALIEEATAL